MATGAIAIGMPQGHGKDDSASIILLALDYYQREEVDLPIGALSFKEMHPIEERNLPEPLRNLISDLARQGYHPRCFAVKVNKVSK